MEKTEQAAFLQALGAHFADVRKGKGVSQEKLGFETGLDVTTISKIERGILNVSSYNAFKIANALRVPIRDLYDFKFKH